MRDDHGRHGALGRCESCKATTWHWLDNGWRCVACATVVLERERDIRAWLRGATAQGPSRAGT